jgi:hypothetical protein
LPDDQTFSAYHLDFYAGRFLSPDFSSDNGGDLDLYLQSEEI